MRLRSTAWHAGVVHADGDQELASLRNVIDALGTARVLTVRRAADLLDLSPSAVRAWCTETSDPLPHDYRAKKRPSRLLSEAELVQYVLDRPTVRHKAVALLRDRSRAQSAEVAPPSRTRSRPAPPVTSPPPASLAAVPEVPERLPAAGAREVAQLRGELIRLQEQVAHLSALIEELEASGARKSALWLAALRSSSVPGTAHALDGLISTAPPPDLSPKGLTRMSEPDAFTTASRTRHHEAARGGIRKRLLR